MTGAKRPGLPCDRSPPGGSPSSAQPLLLLYIVVSVWLFPVCRCRWKHKALKVEQHIVAGGKAHGRGKIAVALMLLIINALAQLTGVFLVPVSCAIWLIVSYLAATIQRTGNPILWG